LTYDNDTRLLWYFDPAEMTWESFEYPDDWEATDIVFVDDDKKADLLQLNPEDISDFDSMIVLDLETGEYAPREYICGRIPKGRWLEWVIYETNSDSYLCHTETGETSPPLHLEVDGEIQEPCPTPNNMLWGVMGGQIEI